MPRALEAIAGRRAPRPPAGLVLGRSIPGQEPELAAAGPLDSGAVFELGSITKALTGLLLADFVVKGEAGLDETLDRLLPGAPALALGDLASHTAGLPRLPWAFVRRSLRSRANPYAGTTVEELVRDAAAVRIRRRRRPRYSNLGAALLGQGLAARAGVPYPRLVHERVIGPLGITGLWAHGAPPVAQPHSRRGRPVPAWDLGAYAPAGCLRGTVPGLLALARSCVDPPGAMADAVALALTVRTKGAMVRFGLGWTDSPARRGERMWWHNGGTRGSRSFVGFIPATGEAVAGASNSPRAPDRAAQEAWPHAG